MAKRPTRAATRVSDEATKRATGKTAAEWSAIFDQENAHLWSHKERVGMLRRYGLEAPWWLQVITVNYERSRGIRLLGEASGAGFEFGISRTMPASPEEAWAFLTTGPGLEAWAGVGVEVELKKGASQQMHGKRIEVRGLTPGVRLRLAKTAPGIPQRTFQMSVTPAPDGRCSVRFHEERLPGVAARRKAERKWNEIMDEIGVMLGGRSGATLPS